MRRTVDGIVHAGELVRARLAALPPHQAAFLLELFDLWPEDRVTAARMLARAKRLL